MRWLLLLLAVAAGAFAAFEGTLARNSYSSYSNEQLDVLSQAYAKEQRGQHQTTHEAEVSQSLLEDERRRRLLFASSIGAAVLLFIGAFLVPGSRRDATASDDGEAARLVAAVGRPSQALAEGSRQRAAALLGVALNAPPEVVEAALQAQLKARDLSRLDGMTSGHRSAVIEEREALMKARDLLLGKRGEA